MTAHTPAKDIIPNFQRDARNAFVPLQREFTRFFDGLGEGLGAFAETRFTPRMDVVETTTGLEVTVELPGLTVDQIQITAEEGVLTVSGEKAASSETTDGAAHVIERSFGGFSRSIYVPRSTDPAKIRATMKDGVLKIEIPKRPGAETKIIEIESN